MLATAHRLRRSADFAEVVRGGRRAGRGAVVVHMLLTDQSLPEDDARSEDRTMTPVLTGAHGHGVSAGFVVSKAVGGATVRNKIRRRLRHLMRERLSALPAGSRVVIRALPTAADRAYTDLGADLDAALTAASVPDRSHAVRRRSDRRHPDRGPVEQRSAER